jgi:hypothetical protein
LSLLIGAASQTKKQGTENQKLQAWLQERNDTKRRPAHMKAYDFVFAKTHGANRWRTVWQRNFLPRLRWRSSSATPPTIPPPCPKSSPAPPSNLSLPSRPYFPLIFSFSKESKKLQTKKKHCN